MPEMGKRGQGSITERPNGLLMISIRLEGGRRVFRYTRDRKEAERIRDELVELRETDGDPTRLTIEAFLREWIGSLTGAKHQRLAPKTLDHYSQIVDDHIIPALGKYRLDRLREHHVQEWLDKDAGSARSVHHHRAVLRRALNVAVRRRLITVNPAIGVELPDATWNGALPLTLDEAKALLATTKGDRLHPLWLLAIDTGLRESELLGLPWVDVDLPEATVTITGQMQRINGEWVTRATKTHRKMPTIAIARSTAAVLEEHKLKMATERTAEWKYFGLVFPSATGQPLSGSVVLHAFREACDRAGIPRRRFHDLRHSTGRLLHDLGVGEEDRMPRMGHSTTAMARRYGHASEVRDREVAELLAKALA
jgi:integrase